MPNNNSHDIVLESMTEALLQLMEIQSFDNITVSELCKKAGVGRVSFYRNFSSKQDILTRYLSDRFAVWWNNYVEKGAADSLQDFWPELIGQYKQNEKFIKLLRDNHVTYILRDHIFMCCGPREEDDEKTAYIRALLAGMIYGVADEWVHRGMKELPEDLSIHDLLIEYIHKQTL